NDERVETKGILVDPPVGLGQRGRFSVRNHDDLTHVLTLPIEYPARQAQPFARIRVVRPHTNSSQFAQRYFFGRVMKENDVQCVAWVLQSDEVRERERHALGRRKSILRVTN